MIQRDFWRIAAFRVLGKYSRTQMTLASRWFRPKAAGAAGAIPSFFRTGNRTNTSDIPRALSLKPMS